jgi:TatD DNase family protein
MLNWIDTHCHFDFDDFDLDRGVLWQNCKNGGAVGLIIPGVSPILFPRVKNVTQQFDNIYYSSGLHPCWLRSYFDGDFGSVNLNHFTQLLHDAAVMEKCVAIGECGLDLFIDGDLAQQETVLICQLELANALNLPVILHCRRAHNELIRCLKRVKVSKGGVVHAFSGSLELAKEYVALGFCLGVGGVITYDRAVKTCNTFKQIPIQSLVLETDAPDMPLQGFQGQRNTPLQIPLVAEALAALREESVEQIYKNTTKNAMKIFSLKDALLCP